MKNRKKLIGWGIGLVCVVLCVILLLVFGGKHTDGKDPSVPDTQTTQGAEATEKHTNGTEPTEELTEPTEETTEPTEETTEPTEGSNSGGSSTPGGTGGFTGSNMNNVFGGDTPGEDTKPGNEIVLSVDDPGTQNNAYAETLGNYPDEFTTVTIPAKQTVCYNIYQAAGTVLTIEDKDAYVVYNGQTYQSTNGLVTVDLSGAAADGPVSLQVGNAAAGETAYSLKFAEPVGAATNPEILTSIDEIKAVIAAGRQDGYFFRWTAEKGGILNLAIANVTPANAKCDIILTNSESTVKASESADGIASVEVYAGEEVLIQVVVEPAGMAAEVLIQGSFTDALGSQNNPIPLTDAESVTAEVGAGKIVYYSGYVFDMTMTVENAQGASVMMDGVTYGADTNGVLTVTFPPAAGIGKPMPVVFALCNGTNEDAVYILNFSYPVGHAMNPAQLALGENTAVLPAGSNDGYWFTWTATDSGELTVTMDPEADWSYTLSNITSGVYLDTQWSDSEPLVSSATLKVSAGDEIQVNVNTFDPLAPDSTPAGNVMFSAAFKAVEEYILCDQTLTLGDTAVTADGSAVTSVFRFTPELAGSYRITTDSASAVLSYWGSDEASMADRTDSSVYDGDTNTLTIAVPEDAVGTATYLIGVTGVEQCVVTIAQPDEETVAQKAYEGKTEPKEKFQLTLNENQSLEYLDLTVESKYKLVLDEKTKIYHLDTLDGPIVYVNLGSQKKESPAPYVSMYELLGLGGSEPVSLYWQHVDEESGETVKELFDTCMKAYAEHADEATGVYPLTEDLMYMLQGIGTQLGWWDPTNANYLFGKLEGTLNKDVAWMFTCCRVVTQDAESMETPPAEPQQDIPAAEPEANTTTEEPQPAAAEPAAEAEPSQESEAEAEPKNETEPETKPQPEPMNEAEPEIEPLPEQEEAETPA